VQVVIQDLASSIRLFANFCGNHAYAAYRNMIHNATASWEYRVGRSHAEVERILKSLYSAWDTAMMMEARGTAMIMPRKPSS